MTRTQKQGYIQDIRYHLLLFTTASPFSIACFYGKVPGHAADGLSERCVLRDEKRRLHRGGGREFVQHIVKILYWKTKQLPPDRRY